MMWSILLLPPLLSLCALPVTAAPTESINASVNLHQETEKRNIQPQGNRIGRTICDIVTMLEAEIWILKNQVNALQSSSTEFRNESQAEISHLNAKVDALQSSSTEFRNETQAEMSRLNEKVNALQSSVTEFQNQTQQNVQPAVAFSVFRNEPLTNEENSLSIITYDGTLVNLGGAMNTSSGFFTVPLNGTYYCSASCNLKTNTSVNLFGNPLQLVVNGMIVASASHEIFGKLITTALSQILSLKVGDIVFLVLDAPEAFDIEFLFFTQFNCFLISTKVE